jgi:CBS domain-containing protein
MRVQEVMSTPVVTVPPDATLQQAIGAMLNDRVGSAVVVEHGPVGIITRSDILRATYHEETALSKLTVRAGMSDDLVTTTPETTVTKALRTMQSHNVKKLPVLSEMGLVGIVTMTDIARHQPERVRTARKEIERKDEWTD